MTEWLVNPRVQVPVSPRQRLRQRRSCFLCLWETHWQHQDVSALLKGTATEDRLKCVSSHCEAAHRQNLYALSVRTVKWVRENVCNCVCASSEKRAVIFVCLRVCVFVWPTYAHTHTHRTQPLCQTAYGMKSFTPAVAGLLAPDHCQNSPTHTKKTTHTHIPVNIANRALDFSTAKRGLLFLVI